MEINDIQYISLGYDCSPASALRILGLRPYALPFDWVVSTKKALENCLSHRFEGYHTELRIHESGTRVIDKFGFLFPHDYPTLNNIEGENTAETDGVVFNEKKIIADYSNYSNEVLAKYGRRISRFLEIVEDKRPLIVLMRCSIRDARFFHKLFKKRFAKKNVVFVVASTDAQPRGDSIFICNPEKYAGWNDTTVWLEAITKAQQSLK